MRVLSEFDGYSGGRLALERAGIKVDAYFASEVDKPAIAVTTANWPQTVQLGDVRNVNPDVLGHIDLLIGGSPCQDFSFSGSKRGMATECKEEVTTLERYLQLKAQGFKFAGQSYLFWEFVRSWRQIKATNPQAKFLLENVKMSKENLAVLSRAMGCEPILVNSAMLSAQNRRRYYWTNWPTTQPEDKGIVLGDILQENVDAKYFLSQKAIDGFIKRKAKNVEKGHGFGHVLNNPGDKTGTLLARYCKDAKECIVNDPKGWRKLTPIECERLQTVPDNYTAAASNSQRYKMLGNGWTVDVIAHLFRGMNDEN